MTERPTPTPLTPAPAPLRGRDDLYAIFEGSFRRAATLVGIECERVAIFRDGTPLRYEPQGDRPGVRNLLDALARDHGWTGVRDYPGAPVLALTRGQASITLEPGSQFELSGAPLPSVHAVVDELTQTRDEFASLEIAHDLRLLGVGFHPFARQEDLDWVPKSRYPIMRSYLPTRGRYGLDMMRRTATVQANFDYTSERDAMRKLRASLALSPVVTALFANSPFIEGASAGVKSHRARVWLDVDNTRAGLLPFAWREGATIDEYIEWALDIPMFILKVRGEVRNATHLTFRRYLADGFEGLTATAADWETHLNTLFPEARLKRTLEVRGADSVPLRYSAALPALWIAALYDDAALDAVEQRCVSLGHDAFAAARADVAARGLKATVGGSTLGEIARDLMPVFLEALRRRAVLDAAGRDERVWLEPLAALAADDRCVADALFEGYDPSGPDAVAEMIRRAEF